MEKLAKLMATNIVVNCAKSLNSEGILIHRKNKIWLLF